jgi:arylsulfatase A-like enzyme
VFAAAGAIDANASVRKPHLFDVAPTVLAALGIPYSDRMDGRVLPVIDDSGIASYGAYDPTRRRRDQPAVEQRLADLGYVE